MNSESDSHEQEATIQFRKEIFGPAENNKH